MFRERRLCDDRRTCIICEKEEGKIQTNDGLVCPSCMPKELVPRAKTIRKHSLIIYQKTNPDWESCAGIVQSQIDEIVEDRSTAITQSSSTTLASELTSQIKTADSIDIVVSFIKLSGLSLLIDDLSNFTHHGTLRVITTSYMGVTEYDSLAELFSLPNTEVRMELKTRSRLHAKCFIFNRSDGNSTAFVGSANISKSALTDGEEWVVKLLEKDVPDVIKDLRLSYEELWSSNNVKTVTAKNRVDIESALESRGR